MYPPATIPAGTTIYDVDTAEQIITGEDIKTDGTIIADDIEVSTFEYNGREYSVDTDAVDWD